MDAPMASMPPNFSTVDWLWTSSNILLMISSHSFAEVSEESSGMVLDIWAMSDDKKDDNRDDHEDAGSGRT